MQTLTAIHDAAGRQETTVEAIDALNLPGMSKAALVQAAAIVSVYPGKLTKAALADAIRDRLLARLFRPLRTCYGSENL